MLWKDNVWKLKEHFHSLFLCSHLFIKNQLMQYDEIESIVEITPILDKDKCKIYINSYFYLF